MKKLLAITCIFSISSLIVFGQGALKTTFNAATTGPYDVAGSKVIIYSDGVNSATAASYAAIALDPVSGDLFAAGQVTILGNQKIIVSRYTKTGTLVTSFGTSGHFTFDVIGTTDQAFAMAINNSNVYIVGQGRDASNIKQPFIASITTAGVQNYVNTFAFSALNNPLGTKNEYATSIAVDANGKLVVGGVSASGTTDDFAVARFNSDGTLDAANFNSSPVSPAKAGTNIFDIRVILGGGTKNDRCNAVAITSGGNIILGGEYERTGAETDYCFVNVSTDGTKNNTWGSGNGIVTYDVNLATSVTQGTNASGEFIDEMKSMVIDGSGNIIAGGSTLRPAFNNLGGGNRILMNVMKLTSAGALDATFGGNGVALIDPISIYGTDPGAGQGSTVNSIALYRGKIILGSSLNGGDFIIIRLNSDSTLDPIFKYDATPANVKNGISRINIGPSDAVNSIISSGAELFAAGNSFGLSSSGSNFTKLTVLNVENSFYTLPLSDLGFIAQKQANSVQLQWKPQIDQSLTTFTVERSTDGRNYRPIGSVNANPSQTSNYSFLDNSPVASVNYYRLAIKNTDDKVVFSNALAVRNSKASASLEVFPNPASQLVYVQLPGSLRGKMNVRMSDVMGRAVATMSFDMIGEATTTSLNVSALNKGIYTISVVDELGAVVTSKHFVKN